MAANNNQKLAVIIDADNAQASVIQELLAEASRYGPATIKHVYGYWTMQTHLHVWRKAVQSPPKATVVKVREQKWSLTICLD